MQATPIRTDVAREFLAEPATRRLGPRGDRHLRHRVPPAAQLRWAGDLVDVDAAPARTGSTSAASWQGAVRRRTTCASRRSRRRTASSGSPVRPNALIVPQSWYAQRFRQVLLYFFDPTSQVLVPDPVFVPRNADLASTLVQRLIAGPAPDLVDYSHNALPAGADPDISAPGSRTTASPRSTSSATSRCPGSSTGASWSPSSPGPCGRSPRSAASSVSVAGQPATPAGQPELSVTTGEAFAPYVADAKAPLLLRPRGRADGRRRRPDPRSRRRAVRPGRPGPAVDHRLTSARPRPPRSPRTARPSTSAPSGPPPSRRPGHARRRRGHRPAGPVLGLRRPALDGRPPGRKAPS